MQFRVPGLGDRLVLAVTGAAVALTAGFAGVAFVRLVGLIVLGTPPAAGRPSVGAELGPVGRTGVGMLAVACLAIAALTPLEIRLIGAGLVPVLPALRLATDPAGRNDARAGSATALRLSGCSPAVSTPTWRTCWSR